MNAWRVIAAGGAACILLGCGATHAALTPTSVGYAWLTAHWVHLDAQHAFANALGWWVLIAFARRFVPPVLFLSITLIFMAALALAWLDIEPQLGYAGLSGVLYAWFSFCAVQFWRCGDRVVAVLLAVSLAVFACAGGTQPSFPVATTAHWLGGLLGSAAGLVTPSLGLKVRVPSPR